MKRLPMVLAAVLFALILFSGHTPAGAQVSPPESLTFQGNISDSGGSPLNGNFSMVFSFFDSAAGGNFLLSDSQAVGVSSGNYAVKLGTGAITTGLETGLPSVFVNRNSVFLEVSVSGQMLSPRLQLNTTGWAFSALNSLQLGGRTANNFLDTSATGQTKSGNLTLLGALTVTDVFGLASGELNLRSGGSTSSFLDLNDTVARPVRMFVDAGDGSKVGLEIADYAAASNDTLTISHDGANALIENTDAAGHIILSPGTTSGKVGIGTTDPEGLLHLKSTATQTVLLVDNPFPGRDAVARFRNFADEWTVGIDSGDGGKFKIAHGGSLGGPGDRLAIELNFGHVGIGTTAPQARLDIVGDGDTVLIPRKSTAGDPTGANAMLYYNSSAGKFRAFEAGSWKDMLSGGGITSLNGLTASSQTFANDANVTVSSAGSAHSLGWSGTLAVGRGGTGASSLTANGVLFGGATVGATAAGADGQFLLGVTGLAPQFAAMSGDASITNTGVLTVSANAVALATDTTGNFVAGLMEGSDVDVTGTPGEGWSPTVSIEPQLDSVSVISRASANLTLQTTTSGHVILNPAGNVGVGVSTPVNKLDVEGAAAIGAAFSGTNTAPTNGLLVEGRVAIGATGLANGAEVLYATRSSAGHGYIGVNCNGTGNYTGFKIYRAGTLIWENYLPPAGDNSWYWWSEVAGLDAMSLSTGGNLTIQGQGTKPGGGSWAASSDLRLKKNVHTLEGSLDKLLALRGVIYEWKEPEKQGNLTGLQIGMIAQEVENVFPEWVREGPDGYKTLVFRGFEALTVESLRELKTENENLRKKVTAQEARLEVLEQAASRNAGASHDAKAQIPGGGEK